MNTPKEILEHTIKLVAVDRAETHGDYKSVYGTVAELWSAYRDEPYTVQDVLVMMALLKIGRTTSGKTNIDDFVDLAGYAALAGASRDGT